MKQIITAIIIASVLVLSSGELKAQSTEIGVIIGEPTGVSAKFWTSGSSAIDLGLA